VRILKADVVGTGHLRLLVSGEDGGRIKAVAFRNAETPLGLALRGAGSRRLWLAGRMKKDDWNGRDSAELHLDDAAFAD
jgi:single-stranded-DNA-specific exonuclease